MTNEEFLKVFETELCKRENILRDCSEYEHHTASVTLDKLLELIKGIKNLLNKFTQECNECTCKCSISCSIYPCKLMKEECYRLILKHVKQLTIEEKSNND